MTRSDQDELLEELQARAAAGEMLAPQAVGDPAIARMLGVVMEAGGPIIPALAAAQDAAGDRAEIASGVRIATAQGKAVATGLLALPLVLVPGLGWLLDLDLLGFYRTPAGAGVGAVALGLATGGAAAARWLVTRATRWARSDGGDAMTDEVVDLVATALAGGTSSGRACRLAADRSPEHADVLRRLALGLELDRPVDLPAPFDRVHNALARAARLGTPAEPALRRLAAAIRAERRTRALESAQRLPALLAFPTALLLLPASVLLVGAPLVAEGLAGTAGAG